MQIIKNPAKKNWEAILKRPTENSKNVETLAEEIFTRVKDEGDKALSHYTETFDKVRLEKSKVSQEEIKNATAAVSDSLKDAIKQAKRNIETFHRSQEHKPEKVVTTNGVTCWQEKRAIEKVGLYIPGGTAPLFSTILMLAVPAKLAGCREIVLCSPPDENGSINPAILYTAQLCGITSIIKAGGIQAIAGLTFGTESVPRVYKIFGPGNQYVTAAKQLATKYGAAIDLPAGPSELLVVADNSAKAEFVAADLLSQAEHGVDSQVVFLTTSAEMLRKVAEEIKQQLVSLSRKKIAEQAIENSKLIRVQDDETALELINAYAPEHFIIATENEGFYIDGVQNAGSVFIGNYTPESAGDYASGTNHTLPTNGYAKQYSGVNLDSFSKSITFQKISEKGIQNIGETIKIMAEAEGLQAHKNAVHLRLESLRK